MKPKSIVLLSGGLDSTVSATIAKKRTRVLFALTIDYGQRAARMEIKAAKKICRFLGIELKIVKVPFFKEFIKLKMIKSKDKKKPRSLNRLADVWIPNRNGLFINIAACYAEYYGAEVIVTGFNREEAREFPDNRPQFIAAINHSLFHSTLNKVKVQSFVSDYSKKQIYQLGKEYNAPLKYIYSCYLGEEKMCGKCGSCRKLQRALE
ncbi:MAG TPA: 7-cyano-7-deazaguanine synthase QueC [candidate division WOR-3 bacterium]|uniref:7-cyano-7-deazaguanine synthase n=1 Tax=candidate division WOR-3 bacterium TaxID=2052148 RepID=A0A9C9JZT9_UNCW3|nr:7-cyano-7-deazaguanine synthase QueC [candidate division WOR-3 bacterium]